MDAAGNGRVKPMKRRCAKEGRTCQCVILWGRKVNIVQRRKATNSSPGQDHPVELFCDPIEILSLLWWVFCAKRTSVLALSPAKAMADLRRGS